MLDTVIGGPREGGKATLIRYTSPRAAAKAAYRLCFYSPHWRVGWRFVADQDLWDRHDLGGTPWRVLSNASFGFFADPLPVIWQGRTYVFFEDFDHRRNKGVISAVSLGPLGPDSDVFQVSSSRGIFPPLHHRARQGAVDDP